MMTFGFGRDGQPAICMTHHAAMEYCRWLSAKTGKVYRLPTEAEWEYACRAGTKTAYSWGNDPEKLDEYAWDVNNAEKPMPVGKKKPNPWGLYDMHGNVAEWCLDHYSADTYKTYSTDKPTVGPVILPDAKEYSYVVRGGSWDDDPEKLRSAARRGSNKEWSTQDPATSTEYLVAHRRHLRGVSGRPASERASQPQGPQVAGRQGQGHPLIRWVLAESSRVAFCQIAWNRSVEV